LDFVKEPVTVGPLDSTRGGEIDRRQHMRLGDESMIGYVNEHLHMLDVARISYGLFFFFDLCFGVGVLARP